MPDNKQAQPLTLATALLVEPVRLTLRAARPAWGAVVSEYSKVHWKRLMTPLTIIKYIIVHELRRLRA